MVPVTVLGSPIPMMEEYFQNSIHTKALVIPRSIDISYNISGADSTIRQHDD
jgi:hypothetical protein